ncbi:hypothetical protein OAS39_09325 [Pirellulales bacterium]|nr:hypothetical protein [Pirellulales bacterium]
MNEIQSINVDQLAQRDAQEKVNLIDVRSPMEFHEVRAAMDGSCSV